MLKAILKFLTLVVFLNGEKIVDYHFHENFGQIFHDYSGSGNNAVNGRDIQSSDGDTTPTDRGAYFEENGSNIITLPENDNALTQLILGNTFTIMMWILSLDKDNRYIFYRSDTSNANYFYYKRLENSKLAYEYKSGNSHINDASLDDIFKKGIFYLEIWQFLSLVVISTTIRINANGINISTQTSEIWNDELYQFYMSIGYSSGGQKSINAFVWNFMIFKNEEYDNIYCGSSASSLNSCLLSSCPDSCNPSIIVSGSSKCISIEKSEKKLGTGEDCSGNCNKVGCFNSIDMCLDCSCLYDSCIISDSNVVCWCPSDAVSTSENCDCNNKGTYDGVSLCSTSCHSNCITVIIQII